MRHWSFLGGLIALILVTASGCDQGGTAETRTEQGGAGGPVPMNRRAS